MNKPVITDTCQDPTNFDVTMKLIGDYWTLRLVDAIAADEVRFCEIERRLPDSNPATLSNRLKKMEEAGLVDRQVETLDRQSVCYRLSSKGREVMPIVESIKAFTQGAS